jgi:hypothetical protein
LWEWGVASRRPAASETRVCLPCKHLVQAWCVPPVLTWCRAVPCRAHRLSPQRIVIPIMLPDNPIFAPALNITAFDSRLGGFLKPDVGTCVCATQWHAALWVVNRVAAGRHGRPLVELRCRVCRDAPARGRVVWRKPERGCLSRGVRVRVSAHVLHVVGFGRRHRGGDAGPEGGGVPAEDCAHGCPRGPRYVGGGGGAVWPPDLPPPTPPLLPAPLPSPGVPCRRSRVCVPVCLCWPCSASTRRRAFRWTSPPCLEGRPPPPLPPPLTWKVRACRPSGPRRSRPAAAHARRGCRASPPSLLPSLLLDALRAWALFGVPARRRSLGGW